METILKGHKMWRSQRKKLRRWAPDSMEAALPGIGSVPWSSLRSGWGDSAEQVPQSLTSLVLAADEESLPKIRQELTAQLAPSGLYFQATPFAVPFLLGIARSAERPGAADIAQLLLEEIAYGEPHRIEWEAGNADLRRDVEHELAAGVDLFYDQFRHGDPPSRAQAVALLAAIDGRAPRFRELLQGEDLEREHPLVIEAVREAREYLNDKDG